MILYMRKLMICLLALVLMPQMGFSQEKRWAVVELSVNNMREQPDYAAEMGDQSLMGTLVEIVGEESYWRQIVNPKPYKAWVNEMGLVEMTETEKDAYLAASKYICIADYARIWSEPSEKSLGVCDFVAGDLVRKCLSIDSKVLRHKDFVKVMLPSGRTGWVRRETVEDFQDWTSSRSATAANVLGAAYRFIGVPYLWGGTSIKGVDCSGLVWSAYFLNGLLLPRNASQQAKVGTAVAPDIEHLMPGDLLFFGRVATSDKPERITHVGIYIGDGMYIHSSQLVRISSIDPASEDYAGRRPLRARRIIGDDSIPQLAASPYYFK
jgi:gamma-D-glutamyl-L-lysine dipeptidyl-peptidase